MLESASRRIKAPKYGTKGEVALSVVIPLYNQESNASTCIHQIKTVVEKFTDSFELIVVNDGSVDGTLRVLENERARDLRVKLVSYAPNKGKGYAVRRGVLEATGDFILFIDGDLEISPNHIGEYVGQLQDNDLVIASKRHPLSKVSAPASRRFLSKGFNLLARMLTGVRVTDTQAGMKAGRADVLKRIFEITSVDRYAFDVELLAVASLMNMRIKEMPVDISLERRFKTEDMWRMFSDVLAIGYKLRIKRWYQKQLSRSI